MPDALRATAAAEPPAERPGRSPAGGAADPAGDAGRHRRDRPRPARRVRRSADPAADRRDPGVAQLPAGPRARRRAAGTASRRVVGQIMVSALPTSRPTTATRPDPASCRRSASRPRYQGARDRRGADAGGARDRRRRPEPVMVVQGHPPLLPAVRVRPRPDARDPAAGAPRPDRQGVDGPPRPDVDAGRPRPGRLSRVLRRARLSDRSRSRGPARALQPRAESPTFVQ